MGGMWPSLFVRVFANESWPHLRTEGALTRYSGDVRCTNINDDGLMCVTRTNGTVPMVHVVALLMT